MFAWCVRVQRPNEFTAVSGDVRIFYTLMNLTFNGQFTGVIGGTVRQGSTNSSGPNPLP